MAEQIAQVRHAEAVKADWVILQPPMVGSFGPAEYISFFGRVAAATNLPVAIQNAPAYMGRGLSAQEINDLVTQHPNICLLKGEGSVADIERVIEVTQGRIPVFNGRGGLELVDSLRAGCAGLILAPDIVDHAVSVYEHFLVGDEADADAAYARMLPAIVFVMQSIEHLICYGKRLFGARAGIAIYDRSPAMRATPFGLTLVERHARSLGAFEMRSRS